MSSIYTWVGASFLTLSVASYMELAFRRGFLRELGIALAIKMLSIAQGYGELATARQ